ncbi:B12-binding domain-containing radical SAM protein [Patescibacteria group bacterium]
MSKVLLINPPFNISKAKYQTSINMGLLCLASYLDKHGIEVKIIDCIRQKNSKDLIKKELIKGGICLIGLSVTIMQVDSALKISEAIKSFNSEMPIIWGGAHATLFPKQTAGHSLIDVAVLGEGEKTLLELVDVFNNKRNLDNVLGIAFKGDNEVVVNKNRDFLPSEEFCSLNWSLMSEEILQEITLVPAYTSRGCPHKCSFCINSITRNHWRSYSVDNVLDDLENMLKLSYFKNKPFRFWDEDFFVDIDRAKNIVQGIIDRKFDIQWETTIRADYIREGRIDDEFLFLLKKSGCYLLSFGGESGSLRVLNHINKGITPDQIINSAKKTLKYQIIPQYSFMVGLPGEKREDILKTIHLIDELVNLSTSVQILGPQPFRPYPGSILYDECLSSGWSMPKELNKLARLVKDELNYLSLSNFPWIKDVDLVESLEAYVRFGAHSVRSALGSTVKSNKLLKLIFILVCQIRWEFKFFKWPIEFKLAKRLIAKT